MNLSSPSPLAIYSAALSTVLAAVVLRSASAQPVTTLDRIKVHRIDVVEPDGTLRMVISNHHSLPGVIVRGKERPPVDRPQAGMLFYNDEGTENGGLIFGGRRNAKGEIVDAGGSLSFDKYGAGQVVQLAAVDDKDNHFAGLAASRVWVGRTDDGTVAVSLKDPSGKTRIAMQVTKQGEPSLVFFDDRGQPVQRLLPAPKR